MWRRMSWASTLPTLSSMTTPSLDSCAADDVSTTEDQGSAAGDGCTAGIDSAGVEILLDSVNAD